MKYLNKLYERNDDDNFLELLPNIPSKNKIISYSLWGDGEYYNYGVLENALWAQKIFPNWTVHIYYKDNLIQKIKEALMKLQNVKMIEIKNQDNKGSNMLWRFIPAFEKDNIVLVRDADSKFSVEEYYCVKEWLESDKDFHIIRWGHRKYKIAPGFWGSRNNILHKFKNKINIYNETNPNYGYDIEWLEKLIYNHIKNKAYIHCDGITGRGNKNNYPIYKNNQFEGKLCKPFPKKNLYFSIIDENNNEYSLANTFLFGGKTTNIAPLAQHFLNEIDGRLHSGKYFPKSGPLLIPGRLIDNKNAKNPHHKSKNEFIMDRIRFLENEIKLLKSKLIT